jgi:hypothetical protein
LGPFFPKKKSGLGVGCQHLFEKSFSLQGTPVFYFALASLIGGIHWALHSGFLEAYLHELLDRQKQSERYSEALGYFGFAKSTANFIAFLGGTLIVGIWEAESFYILIALTVFCVGLALLGMFSLPGMGEYSFGGGWGTSQESLNFSLVCWIWFSEISTPPGTSFGEFVFFFGNPPPFWKKNHTWPLGSF